MSNEAITWAFRQELPSTDKFVLIALADYADENLSCYPSHKKTAQRVGSSVATVKRAVTRLTEKGYISVEKRNRSDGSITSNRYVINIGRQDPPAHSEPGVQNEPTSAHSCEPTSAHSPAPTSAHSYEPAEPALTHHPTITDPSGAADADAGVVVEAEVVEDKPAWDLIAQRAYDGTQGALPYMGMRGIAKWAIERKAADPTSVETAIAGLYRSGQAVTKQSVAQVLDGVRGTRKRDEYTPSWQKRLDANVQAAQADMNRDRGVFEIGE